MHAFMQEDTPGTPLRQLPILDTHRNQVHYESMTRFIKKCCFSIILQQLKAHSFTFRSLLHAGYAPQPGGYPPPAAYPPHGE